MAQKVGVSILVRRDVQVDWCDQMLRKVLYILVIDDSHYETLIICQLKKQIRNLLLFITSY